MSLAVLPYEVPQPVARKVSRLRLLVRLYSLAEGLAAAIIVVSLGFWAGLAIDWLFEPSPTVRMAMWAVVVAAVAAAAWRYAGRRLAARLPDDSLALLVERQYPELRESMITAVQAAKEVQPADDADDGFNRLLIELAGRNAAASMPAVALGRVFNMRPLVRKGVAAIGLLGAIALFALAQRSVFDFYLDRLQLDPRLWPRRVELTVVGFEERENSPVVNVARDDDHQLTVLASLADGHQAPEEVEIRWRRPSDGGRGGGPMLRIGDAEPGRDAAQQYRYAFKVSGDLEFDVIGGDDRVRNLRLHAVERPTVVRVWLEIDYPAYMQREPRSAPVSGRIELPEGAFALCRVEANKPLVAVDVRDSDEQTNVAASIDPQQPRMFSFSIEPAQRDRTFAVVMHDADGVENREPFRLPMSVVPDLAPEASIQLRGIGAAVTPQATIPFVGRLTDDHGLQEAWFEYRIDEQSAARRLLQTQPDGMTTLPMTERFDLSEVDPETRRPALDVQPGQKLALLVKARDAYDLGETPHVGGSQQFLLDVVTPSDLRAILEKRELGLRQRFEAIHEKMIGVRDLIDRIDLAAATREAEDNTESGEAPAPPAAPPSDASSGRVRQRDLSRVGGARQSATQLAFETGGVAEGFDEIVAELINNRVDTEELKERLEQGVSEPLKEISGELLPQLEERLATLEQAYRTNVSQAAEPLAAAKSAAQTAEEAMQAVLNRMLELESYNELVELLRGIVNEQRQLKERTQRQQREKLRGLLED